MNTMQHAIHHDTPSIPDAQFRALLHEIRTRGYITNETVSAIPANVFEQLCCDITTHDRNKNITLSWDTERAEGVKPMTHYRTLRKPFTFISLDETSDMFEVDYAAVTRGGITHVTCSILLSRRKQRRA